MIGDCICRDYVSGYFVRASRAAVQEGEANAEENPKPPRSRYSFLRGEILVAQQPHYPAGNENSTHKHREAIETVADLVAWGITLRDSEDNGRKHGK